MNESSSNFDHISQREGGLRRALSTGQLSMIAIGGAIGTGLFLGSAFAIGSAGPSVLISYAIGAVIALLLMGCLAEMSVAHPTAGSFGDWAEFYISPLAGFLVRYSYWSAAALAVGTEVTAVAVYMKFWYPGVPGWIWVIGFSAALILINCFHVKAFGAIEYSFSALKVTAILVFLALGSWVVYSAAPGAGIGFSNYVSHGGFFPHGFRGTWVGVIIALFSYFSLEAVAIAAGEASDPNRAIVRAFRLTLGRLVLFYLLTLTLVLAIVPWTLAGSTESPFVKVMVASHLRGAAGIMNFVILIASLSAMNSQIYSTARIMFSLSRGGYAPRWVGKLNAHGAPVAALALSCLGIAVAAVLNAWKPAVAFPIMIAISIFGAMFAWLMIFVTHFFFRRRHAGEKLVFRMWGYPYANIAGAGLMASAMITTLFTREFHMTLLYGIPSLVVLALCYLCLRPRTVADALPVSSERS